jgi:hypothetical protein
MATMEFVIILLLQFSEILWPTQDRNRIVAKMELAYGIVQPFAPHKFLRCGPVCFGKDSNPAIIV